MCFKYNTITERRPELNGKFYLLLCSGIYIYIFPLKSRKKKQSVSSAEDHLTQRPNAPCGDNLLG